MKNTFIKILFLLSFSAMFLGVSYSDFSVVSDAENVILTWQTGNEDNLKETIIERKVEGGVYSSIEVIAAKGDNSSYTYVDENAFKTQNGFYYYRLKFVDTDGSSNNSQEQKVAHFTSVGKKTWGSIKALFR